jgi:F-type H+-transporting ATPase subunit c
MDATKEFAAALAIMLPLTAVGLALAHIFATWLSSIARNPAAASKMQLVGILGFALTEAIALFALVVAFLILFG